jgi:hypothetical protein
MRVVLFNFEAMGAGQKKCSKAIARTYWKLNSKSCKAMLWNYLVCVPFLKFSIQKSGEHNVSETGSIPVLRTL